MEIPGIVEYVRYRNDAGFAILSVSLNALSSKYQTEMEDVIKANIPPNKYDNFTVSTNMMDSYEKPEGRQYIFVGDFFKHPKYGEQFKAEFYYQDEPKTIDGLKCYLMTLPNIKEARSSEIIQKFGVDETIRILDEDPMRLVEINGITEPRVKPIKDAWDRDKALRHLYVWLGEHEISPAIGKKVYDKWKQNSLEILIENPYRLTEIKGIGFLTADIIAHKISPKVHAESRLKSCMLFILNNDIKENSNLCIPYTLFKQKTIELIKKCDDSLGNTENNYNEYLNLIPSIIKSDLLVFAPVKDVKNDIAYIYLREIWDREQYIASQIFKRHQYNTRNIGCTDEELKNAETDLISFCGKKVDLDESQRSAIRTSFSNRITVITGAGGSGKSTICRCIFYIAQEKGLSVRLMSPTGKAAQVLGEKIGASASTIHRSLRMKPGDDCPRENIQEDVVIIDEISMCGIDTMFAIFKALEQNLWAHVIMVGDQNQLPSVSPGNFLSDIISSGCASVVKLDKIHRQSEHSYISLLANQIAIGKIISIPSDASDIKWHDARSDYFEENFTSEIKNIINNYGGLDSFQIISPMYKGNFGVNKINEIVQKIMVEKNSSQQNFIQFDINRFYVGDRVIQIDNNYDKQIFNGDIGHIVSVGEKLIDPQVSDKKERYMTVNFYGTDHCYLGDDINQIRLAWAITVHKFQGSQSPNIIFIMADEQRIMMSKELVYTAFTRASQKLDIYGHINMLELAPTRSSIRKRYTNVINIIEGIRTNTETLQVMFAPHSVKGIV